MDIRSLLHPKEFERLGNLVWKEVQDTEFEGIGGLGNKSMLLALTTMLRAKENGRDVCTFLIREQDKGYGDPLRKTIEHPLSLIEGSRVVLIMGHGQCLEQAKSVLDSKNFILQKILYILGQ